ncbi:MAG: ABC transporter permease [Ilumatobacteraceae bacterium]
MTAVPDATVEQRVDPPSTDQRAAEPPTTAPPTGGRSRHHIGSVAGVVRWTVALGGAVLIYAAFLALNGADPVEALRAMWDAAFGDSTGVGETLIRTAPLLLGALAVVVPARAGLFNIGGQGQMVMGAIGAVGMSFALDGSLPQLATLVLLGLAGAAAGAAWSAIPAVLRLTTSANEAITSLLLNYVAGLVLTWLVFERWKDPASLGQAFSEELDSSSRLPILWGERVHAGILIAVIAAFVIWWLLRSTTWGFRLGVLGGNPEAARRAGFRVDGLAVGAMLVGGALAGVAGMVEVTGVEARLRPDMLAGYGYIAFLASWLARHDPLKAIVSSIALAAIFVGGFGLKISAGLSGAAVNVLMALVLLAVLGFAQKKEV